MNAGPATVRGGLTALFLLIFSVNGQAQTSARGECASQIEQARAARTADDFGALERIAQRVISACTIAEIPAKLLVAGYSMLATAQYRQERYAESLASSERGIATYYSNLDCHMLRWQSLVMLKRELEALTEIKITKKLAQAVVDEEFSMAATQSERQALLIDKKWALAQLSRIEIWELSRK